MLEVSLQSTMLISPTLGTESVDTVQAGSQFEPIFRTTDSKWYLIKQGENVGWLAASNVKFDAADSANVPSVAPEASAVKAGPNFAVVFNGGNIRYRPDVKKGTVLGQLHAGQQITLKEQTVDGAWFKVVAPEAEGWVSVTLLEIDLDVIANVPTSK
jgi:uncharacterized protein YgiM (DUF1202 family)